MQMTESFYAYYKSLGASQPDKILLAFFVPEDKREAILWLDIFAHEIRNIGRSVTSPHMGLIKLQWWRDEIKKLYAGENNPPSPILEGLKKSISAYQLPFDAFDRILTAHECDVQEEPAGGLADLTEYVDGVSVPLMMLKKTILDNERGHDTAWNSVALASGLIGMLHHRYYHSMSQIVVEKARNYLEGDASITCRYLRAQKILAKLYCAAFERAGYNPLLLKPIPFKELRVWWGTR